MTGSLAGLNLTGKGQREKLVLLYTHRESGMETQMIKVLFSLTFYIKYKMWFSIKLCISIQAQ
uniref:Uncharacterized protein n=1 Tax=Cannabis sativa TaxID=3483 RepID=A0A803R468_CANSA